MSDIPPIKGPAERVTPIVSSRSAPVAEKTAPDMTADQVDISETGQLLSTLTPGADIRADKVAEVREAIQNGTYETPEKIEATVDRLLEVLRAL